MASLSLSQELVDTIVDQVAAGWLGADATSPALCRQTLRACALSHSAFRARAQSYLFQHVYINSPRLVESLRSAFGSRPSLAFFPRQLSVDATNRETLLILESCPMPNLQEILIERLDYSEDDLDKKIESMKLSDFLHVHKLGFMSSTLHLPFLSHLLRHIPVHQLTMYSCTWHSDSHFELEDRSDDRLKPVLEQVSIFFAYDAPEGTWSVDYDALANALGDINELHLSICDQTTKLDYFAMVPAIQTLVDRFSSTLQRLDVEGFNEVNVLNLTHLTQLEAFTCIEDYPNQPYTENCLDAAVVFTKHLSSIHATVLQRALWHIKNPELEDLKKVDWGNLGPVTRMLRERSANVHVSIVLGDIDSQGKVELHEIVEHTRQNLKKHDLEWIGVLEYDA